MLSHHGKGRIPAVSGWRARSVTFKKVAPPQRACVKKVILRKGGIREPTFTPAAATFLLFPTSFHSKMNLLTLKANDKYQQELAFDQKKATLLTMKYVANVTGCWTTYDPRVLSALSEHHVWTDDFLESRLRWRAKQPITVLELRVAQLPEPLVIPSLDNYWGCFSWTDVHGGVSSEMLQIADPVLQDSLTSSRNSKKFEWL